MATLGNLYVTLAFPGSRRASAYESVVADLGLTTADVEEARTIAQTSTYTTIGALYAVDVLKHARATYPDLMDRLREYGITDPADQVRAVYAYKTLAAPSFFGLNAAPEPAKTATTFPDKTVTERRLRAIGDNARAQSGL